MAKPIGYCVFESCDEYEQGLAMRTGPGLPPGGVLDWCAKTPRRQSVAVFPSRAAATAAISRTEHYRLAFSAERMPEKRYCAVVPLVAAPEGGSHG